MEGFKKLPKMQCFKEGGTVTNVYEAKKSSGDKDNIRKVKATTPAKAAAPSKAAIRPNFKGSDVAKEKSKPAGDKSPTVRVKTGSTKAEAPSAAKKSNNTVRKFQYGGSTGGLGLDQAVKLNRATNAAKYLSPAQQAQLAAQQQMATRQYGSQAPMPAPAPAAVDTMGGVTGMAMQKRGGKVKKGC